MKIVDKASAIANSAHTGRALKVAKVLNLLGTVRGAVTTVLLAASAIGVGTATVQTVQKDQAADRSTQPARVAVRPSAPPTPTPLSAAGLKADADRRLQAALAANAQAVDDLRKIAVLQGAPLDALINDAKARLQARYEQAVTQVNELLTPAASASAVPGPSPSLSVISVNAVVQLASSDMATLVVLVTRQATEPLVTPKPTVAPTPVRTVAPTLPPRTPSPTVPRPSATISR